MKVFVCTDHDGHYPVGVASVVIAKTEQDARLFLDNELKRRHLKPSASKPYTLAPLMLDHPGAMILRDGNY